MTAPDPACDASRPARPVAPRRPSAPAVPPTMSTAAPAAPAAPALDTPAWDAPAPGASSLAPGAPMPALPVRFVPAAPYVPPSPAPHVPQSVPYRPPAPQRPYRPSATAPDWLVFTSGLSRGRPASSVAVAEARARLRRRKKARQILASEPDLALELRIGRPDLSRDYDDGGLIDVNHVPVEVLVRELEIPEPDARRLVEQRETHGGFNHPEELVFYCDLTPERLNVISGRLVFVPA